MITFSASSSLIVTEMVSSLICEDFWSRLGRGMIGVKAGDGLGVGSSRIGDKHLLIFPGTSSKIVGG